MIQDQFINALKILSSKLSKESIQWYITGKFNLFLQGINIKPSKIGILIENEDLDRFLTLFNEFEQSEIEELPNGEAKEFFLNIDTIKILVCAEYSHGLFRKLNHDIVFVEIDDILLPCFSLQSERKAYECLKMVDKATIIAEHLDNLAKH